MKHQQPMVTIALLLATSITVFSNPSSEEKQRNRLQMLRTEAARQKHLPLLDRAYLDALSLLQQGNTCGEFFGGAASAQVLDKLAVTLQIGPINDSRIGLR